MDELGYMRRRFASINDLPIQEADRKFRWERKVWLKYAVVMEVWTLPCVMLKALSIIGQIRMASGLLGLLAMRNLFLSSALIIFLQVGAHLLFLWARTTFGWRSYHVVVDPTEGGLVTS